MALPVSISIDVAAGRTTVRFQGELDMSCRAEVEAVAESLSRDGSDVIFNLEDLSFIDSTGLLAILEAKRVLNQRGRTVQVVGAGGGVLKVIELTGLAHELNLQP